MKKINKLALRAVCTSLAVVMLCAFSASCAFKKPPKIEDVRDRITWILDNTYEINEIIWGKGLPTIKYGSEEDVEHHIYDPKTYDGYEIVVQDCPYFTVTQIKTEAEKYYSQNYLKDIYVQIFDGYTFDNQHYNYARYVERPDGFYAYSKTENIVKGKRIYDYSTMKIVKPSRSDFINVSMISYLENDPDNKTTETLSFIFENGNWFLDSPSF